MTFLVAELFTIKKALIYIKTNRHMLTNVVIFTDSLSSIYLLLNRSPSTPLEFVFQEQGYSSLHSGWSLAWDHVRGDIDDPCGAIADPCGVVAICETIGGRRCGDAVRCATH